MPWLVNFKEHNNKSIFLVSKEAILKAYFIKKDASFCLGTFACCSSFLEFDLISS